MSELGIRAGGSTLHHIDSEGHITKLAESFGDPLVSHSRNLTEFIQNTITRQARSELVTFAKDKGESMLAEQLKDTTSFRQMGELLQNTGLLSEAVTHLSKSVENAHMAAAFTVFAQETHSAILLARFTNVDNMKVNIVDTNDDGKLDTGDILAMQIGETSTIQTVDNTSRDRLQIAEAMQSAAHKMSDPSGSAYEFHGFPPKFNEDFFELSRSSFQLKPGASASEAIKDITDNPEHYKFECAT
ncbi:hypothetical protein KAI87_13565, partial [Myxococcota bacterium]|nr:hypothetical protein [Myxococcota bacterium]